MSRGPSMSSCLRTWFPSPVFLSGGWVGGGVGGGSGGLFLGGFWAPGGPFSAESDLFWVDIFNRKLI